MALQVEAHRRSVHRKVKQLTLTKSSQESSASQFLFGLPLVKKKKWTKTVPTV